MTKIAVWCRHQKDSIIGIGPEIPWRIPSDTRRFRNLTQGHTLVVGKNTYESFPNRTLPNRKMVVVVAEPGYEVSDKDNHVVITDLNKLNDFTEDLYISSGASIYDACFSSPALMPDIAVDSVYCGNLNPNLSGRPVTVSRSVEVLERSYEALPKQYELDNVKTTVWVKKGASVNRSVIDSICNYLETEGK
ncbi:MAG: dihydrofolate reductase [Alphaproteobacteria bacterium]|nr:dihydrofolate reductase [Alphaproteobacteria bacterium]